LPNFKRAISALVLGAAVVLAGHGILPAQAASNGIWISQARLQSLPTSGAAWNELIGIASAATVPGNPTLIDQDSMHSRNAMATALVAARLDSDTMRAKVRDAIKRVKGTEDGSELASNRLLQLGRNMPGYIIAADLIGLRTFDPAFDGVFRSWISAMRTRVFPGAFKTIVNADEHDPANWGAYDGATRAAIAAYLGDTADLARSAAAMKSFVSEVGDGRWLFRPDVHDMSWQCSYPNASGYTPINGACSKAGKDLDGVMAQDMARAGGFQWPPVFTAYARENLNGRTIQAEILFRAGYTEVYQWGRQGLRRAAQALRRMSATDAGWWECNQHVHRLITTRTGVAWWGLCSPTKGRSVIGVGWTHTPSSGSSYIDAPGTIPTPNPTPKPTADPAPTVAPTGSPWPTVAPTATPKPIVTPAPTGSVPTPTPAPTTAPTATPTTAPTATPAPIDTPAPWSGGEVFAPVADAKLNAGSPNGVYLSNDLWLKGQDRAALLKFDVSELPRGTVERAVVRIYVLDASDVGGTLYRTVSSWSEHSVTWNTRPSVVGEALWTNGKIILGEYIEFDVTATVQEGGVVSFLLTDGSANSAVFASREAGAGTAPVLRVTLAN
jgi:hypothetical protein